MLNDPVIAALARLFAFGLVVFVVCWFLPAERRPRSRP